MHFCSNNLPMWFIVWTHTHTVYACNYTRRTSNIRIITSVKVSSCKSYRTTVSPGFFSVIYLCMLIFPYISRRINHVRILRPNKTTWLREINGREPADKRSLNAYYMGTRFVFFFFILFSFFFFFMLPTESPSYAQWLSPTNKRCFSTPNTRISVYAYTNVKGTLKKRC